MRNDLYLTLSASNRISIQQTQHNLMQFIRRFRFFNFHSTSPQKKSTTSKASVHPRCPHSTIAAQPLLREILRICDGLGLRAELAEREKRSLPAEPQLRYLDLSGKPAVFGHARLAVHLVPAHHKFLLHWFNAFLRQRDRSMVDSPTLIAPAPYVTVALAAVITGLTEKAIRRKIEDGKWLEGREYRRSPDGGIFISIKGYQQWVEQAAA
jgi:hypothetical protein